MFVRQFDFLRFVFVEEIARQNLYLVSLVRSNPNIVLNHQLGQLLTVNQYDSLAQMLSSLFGLVI